LSRPIIVRTRGESHQWDGITDPKRLQLPFATKSANSGHRQLRCGWCLQGRNNPSAL
jgi:hypothetical protein